MFACKRARPDVLPTVSALCTQAQGPEKGDWNKSARTVKCLSGTVEDKLTLSATKGASHIEWFIDAALTVHPDFRSRTGAVKKFKNGKGAAQSVSMKQKLNTTSSTTAESAGVADALLMVAWTPLFLEEQGHKVESNAVCQDNQSTMLLEKNGKKSSGKRTRVSNMCCFVTTDCVEKGDTTTEHCPTDDVVGDCMSKGLQGTEFMKLRRDIMGMEQ